MLAWLALLFVAVPLIELALLIQVGQWMGLGATVALVMVTGVLGATLARYQGLSTLRRFQQATASGKLPHRELLEGLLILLAGAVLLTPGLLTDVAGFSLLVPPVRAGIAALLARSLAHRVSVVTSGTGGIGTQFGGSGPAGSPSGQWSERSSSSGSAPNVTRASRGDSEGAIDVDFEVGE